MAITENLIVAFVGVGGTILGTGLGWVLSIATEGRREKSELIRKKKAVISELIDMSVRTDIAENLAKDECIRYLDSFTHSIRRHPNHFDFEVLQQYFKEISHSLSDIERANIYILKGHIASVNGMISNFSSSPASNEKMYNYIQRFNVFQKTLALNRFLKTLVNQGLDKAVDLESGLLQQGLDEADDFHIQAGRKLGINA